MFISTPVLLLGLQIIAVILAMSFGPVAANALDASAIQQQWQREMEKYEQSTDNTKPSVPASSSPLHHQSRTLFAHQSLETAWETAVEQQKPLLVMFSTKHCGYCTKMLKNTYGDPEIRRLLAQKLESVVAHAEDHRPMIQRMGIRSYPLTVIISPDGEVLGLLPGYVEARKFAKRVSPLINKEALDSSTTVAVTR